MNITEVKVTVIENEMRLKASANIVFDDCFLVKGLKIISGSQGLFVAMPSRKLKNGRFQDIVHPLNAETRSMIEEKVISAYEEKLKDMVSSSEQQ
ncbi:MAG TPA: septation regulator SpoVG [Chitinispirillaceae bacterium]|nr:septation regulator SpoVG [Chitinispirillaceae bacterium]